MAVELSNPLSFVIANGSDDFREQMTEIRELCDPKLTEPLSEFEAESLLRVFESTRSAQRLIDQRLEEDKISPEDYLTSLKEILKRSSQQEQNILGRERFMCVFGEAGLHPEGLVDTGEFLASFD